MMRASRVLLSNRTSFAKRFFGRQASTQIQRVHARQIFDSRGNPTVEVDCITDRGLFRAAVPSGASTGSHEAIELRDKGTTYHGKGVSKAVDNVNGVIAPALLKSGINVADQRQVDDLLLSLDGTNNKGKLGANAILGVSLAVCCAGAASQQVPLFRHLAKLAGRDKVCLPVPALNVVNGGSHAGNELPMQEFMILPTGADSFSEAMRLGSEVYHSLKSVIRKRYGQDACNVGDEGGFAPNISSSEEALQLLADSIAKAGYTGRIEIGMDVAASEFYDAKSSQYNLGFKAAAANRTPPMSSSQLGDVYRGFLKKFPIVTVEDPFDQDDWEAWVQFTKSVDIQIVGDDLTVTNPERVKKAANMGACNGLLLKVNQIGTVSESIDACNLALSSGWGTMVSHRSGETENDFIADLVVGLATGQIKTGAPCRSERLAKYNQLLRIEEQLGSEAVYAGRNFRQPRL